MASPQAVGLSLWLDFPAVHSISCGLCPLRVSLTSSVESISGNSSQHLNTQTSNRLRRISLPAPGTGTPGRVTPRGVFVGSGGVLGMSLDDLGLDHGIALNEKGAAPSGPITKIGRAHV